MPSKTEDLVDEPPTSINPYRVLDLEKDATADQIKTAYRKAALKNHPDKVSETEKDSANAKFQEIAFAYAILSDPRRRSRYDVTGRTSESLAVGDGEDGEFNWTDFYRAQFKEIINSDAIERFKKEYQGSDEEKMAVIESYVMNEGDMDAVYEEVMLSNPLDDDERFRAIIDVEIEAKRVEAYDAYTKETKASKRRRKENVKKEAAEAEETAKELGVHDQLFKGGDGKKKKAKGKSKENDTAALASLIQQRQKQRSEDFFADLEAKYAPKKGTLNSKRRAADEPPEIPEEAFEQTEKNRKSKKIRILEEEGTSSPRKSKRAKR